MERRRDRDRLLAISIQVANLPHCGSILVSLEANRRRGAAGTTSFDGFRRLTVRHFDAGGCSSRLVAKQGEVTDERAVFQPASECAREHADCADERAGPDEVDETHRGILEARPVRHQIRREDE